MPRQIQLPTDESPMGPEYQRRVQEVDPDLIITNHRITGWAVWREEADERGTFYRRIAACKPGVTEFNIDALCAGLRQRDTYLRGRSHVDQMEQHLKEIEKEEADREQRMVEAFMPHHEELAWTVARSTGDLTRQISLAGVFDKPAAITVVD